MAERIIVGPCWSEVDSFYTITSSSCGRDADGKRCSRYTGRAAVCTEPVVCTGAEDEIAATWSWGHSSEVFWPTWSPSSRYYRLPEASGAQTDMEGHCRGSKESYSQPTSSSQESGSSSFRWPHGNTWDTCSFWWVYIDIMGGVGSCSTYSSSPGAYQWIFSSTDIG